MCKIQYLSFVALQCSGLTNVEFGTFYRADGSEITNPLGETLPDGDVVTLKCQVTDDPALDYEKQLYCAYDEYSRSRQLFGGDMSCFGKCFMACMYHISLIGQRFFPSKTFPVAPDFWYCLNREKKTILQQDSKSLI